jgi:hypothetical protein
VYPASQVHVPWSHTSALAQVCAHAPQLLASFWRFRHNPLQTALPDAQVHTLPTQTSAKAQVCPHAPQLEGSALKSTHAFEQSMSGDVQAAAHVP